MAITELTENECLSLMGWCTSESTVYERRGEGVALIDQIVQAGFEGARSALRIVANEIDDKTGGSEHDREGVTPPNQIPAAALRKFAAFCDGQGSACNAEANESLAISTPLGAQVALGSQIRGAAWLLVRDLLRRTAGPEPSG